MGQDRIESLADAVYETLHRQIVTGHYRPNQRLVETAIAAELGGSRTPVREALLRLTKDGLAVRTSQGLTVREFTLVEIREIYEVRAALEGFAARLAASRASDDQLRDMQLKHERVAHTAHTEHIDRVELVEANADFHNAVVEAAGNSRLSGFSTRNLAYFFNTEIAALSNEHTLHCSIDEHTAIMAALTARDPDAAERCAREHVMSGLRLVEDFHSSSSAAFAYQ